jgi:Autoinducer binding domain
VHSSASQRVLTEALDRLGACQSDDARWLCGVTLLQNCGSQWVTAGTAPLARQGDVAVRSTAPVSLLQDYVNERLHRDDPWMQLCARSTKVDILDTAAPRIALPGSKGRLATVFADHGVLHAALVPCYGGHRTGGIVL